MSRGECSIAGTCSYATLPTTHISALLPSVADCTGVHDTHEDAQDDDEHEQPVRQCHRCRSVDHDHHDPDRNERHQKALGEAHLTTGPMFWKYRRHEPGMKVIPNEHRS